jgi:thymidylate synthase
MHADKVYLDLVGQILVTGKEKSDRTGVGTLSIPHASLSFDLAEGFPLLTTKKVPFKVVKVELEGFLKGIKSKAWFQERGCRIWDEWCNPEKVPYGNDETTKQKMLQEDDLGEIYGVQWRDFNNEGYDQLKYITDTLKTNPYDRRMVCSAWNPIALKKQALPPCHYNWVVSVDDRLHLSFSMRSVDVGLGLPFNIASYSLLAHLLSLESNIPVGTVTAFLNNVHIYKNHVDILEEQLARKPYTSPTIITENFTSIYDWSHNDTKLINYKSHEKLSMPIAV